MSTSESNQPEFNEPRLAINRVYTRRGDTGQTSLVGGQRVPKDSSVWRPTALLMN